MTLQIYTDGSFKKGKGSWAFVHVQGDEVVMERAGVCRRTTSLRMELQAAIEALACVAAGTSVTLFCDSRIVVDAMTTKRLLPRSGPNHDLLSRLDGFAGQLDLSWQWVRAHAGIVHNERCDHLCRQARGGLILAGTMP